MAREGGGGGGNGRLGGTTVISIVGGRSPANVCIPKHIIRWLIENIDLINTP